MPTSKVAVWLVPGTVGGLLFLWATFWFLLLWDRHPGRVTSVCCALLTAVSLTLAFVGLALGAMSAPDELPSPTAEPAPSAPSPAAPASAKPGATRSSRASSVLTVAFGHRYRVDRPRASAARVCRPHPRFRWHG
jgi:hypothetical protein